MEEYIEEKINHKNYIKVILILLGAILLYSLTLYNNQLPGDWLEKSVFTDKMELEYGQFHNILNYIFYIGSTIFTLFFLIAWFTSGMDNKDVINWEYFKKIKIMKKRNLILCIITVIILGFGYSVTKSCVKLYNQNIGYVYSYEQKKQERMAFYDKMWLTYSQKENIVKLNREMFFEVSEMIMEMRKDSEKLTWKWLSESQQIPYSEFVKFYSDLSTFIQNQREGYFLIEKEAQNIVNSQNILLDTFPNNLYNKILGKEKIKYEFGFRSEKGIEVFDSKIEKPY